MGGELVAEVSVPLYGLHTGTLLPHSPEELTSLSVSSWIGAPVFILQQPSRKGSFVLHLLHIVFYKVAGYEDKRVGIIIVGIHGELTLVVEEARVTLACTLEYLKVVLLVSDTSRDRRNHTFRVMLRRFLPVCHLRVVGTVEVATTHRVEVFK